MYLESMECCGVLEIGDLSDSPVTPASLVRIYSLAVEHWGSKVPFLIFTGKTTGNYGQQFARLIKKYKVGSVIETLSKRNPNSGNHIKVWVWTVNWKALAKVKV